MSHVLIWRYPSEAHFTKPAIERAKLFAPYADLLWLETKTPDIKQARHFAREIRKSFPEK